MSAECKSADQRRKSYQELTLTDEFMLRKLLVHDADLRRRLVELLLDVNVFLGDEDEFPRRTLCYQSMIDIDSLDAGTSIEQK